MKITVESQDPSRAGAELLAVPLASLDTGAKLATRVAAVDRAIGGQIAEVVRSGDFRGRKGESLLLFGRGAPRRVLLLGLGDEAKLDAEAVRQLAGRAVAGAAARRTRSVAIAFPATRKLRAAELARALAEGATLASYRPDAWKTKKNDAPPALGRVVLLVEREADVRAAREAAELGATIAECQNVARRLSNEPANALPPAQLAAEARRVANEVGLRCRIFDVPELRRRKMGALLGVGQGSTHPPRLVVIEHVPRPATRARRTVCVIGKGITFDSGGISIKPAGGMHDMKHDMSGAAAVVGILRAAALLEIPLHVVGVIAAAENMPGGEAYRPGDVLTSMSGQTIEIQNTDAEGRLVLCDAIHFARTQYEPDAIIDLATLTGACVVALGSWTSGLFGNHEALCDAIRRAGATTGERAWPMPMADEHRDEMRSQVADLKNVSGSRDAGASTAAAFLSHFVGDTPWAHLDIAGTAYTSKTGACQPYGATGVGVRLVTEVLQSWPHGGL
ncbi:MAG: leucyl aminopeptidase [Proteobacteria bacterium]|nr:MAG: leucyl aminopeptidase [Pseudomonadota bacterium]